VAEALDYRGYLPLWSGPLLIKVSLNIEVELINYKGFKSLHPLPNIHLYVYGLQRSRISLGCAGPSNDLWGCHTGTLPPQLCKCPNS